MPRRGSDETATGPPGEIAIGLDLKVVEDAHGRLWICPVGVDECGDLAAQGCWRRGDAGRRRQARRRRGCRERRRPGTVDASADGVRGEERS